MVMKITANQRQTNGKLTVNQLVMEAGRTATDFGGRRRKLNVGYTMDEENYIENQCINNLVALINHFIKRIYLFFLSFSIQK